MKIQKFGGSILKNSQDIELISDLILSNEVSVSIFSAFLGITDALIKLANIAKKGLQEYEMQLEFIENFHVRICQDLEIKHDFIEAIFHNIRKSLNAVFEITDLPNKTLDSILAYGEILSSLIVYEYLKKQNNNIQYLDATRVIKTDSNFGHANVNIQDTEKLILDNIKNDKLYIIAGFIGSDSNNNTTTLGRNGSDFTAGLIASILNSKAIIIWKALDGIFTTDPKIVPTAIQIDRISYKEMAELSYFGSKVISLQALQPAIAKNISIVVRSVYNKNNTGSKISNETNEDLSIKGVSKIDDIALISINGLNMIGVSGFSARVFTCLHKNNINIVLIAQSSSEISICIGIKSTDLQNAKNAIKYEFQSEIGRDFTNFEIKENQSIIAIAGFGMKNIPGIANKIFSNLAKGNININAIAQGLSKINISFSINSNNANLAVKLIHNSIFENKRLNCVIAGNGTVGSSVVKMIRSQTEYFSKKGVDLNIVGIFNSKKYMNCSKNIEEYYNNFDEIIEKFKQTVDINYTLIDCTSSDLLVENYQKFIENGFNIITPNKKANTLDIEKFENLQKSLQENKKHFFYEANVGAGLPIISTIKDLLDCGDEIIKIEGIFSGTLSYIFNNLLSDKKFSEIIQDAKEKGFTEPNPKDDLSGSDVGRKLLILARMIGYKMNLNDIEIQNLSEISDEDIITLNQKAHENNEVLRYIGIIENGKVSTKLISVPNDNPLASTEYTDNIISITTKFYNKTPLIIRGPGAGADVTAIGIVSDLIKLSHLL